MVELRPWKWGRKSKIREYDPVLFDPDKFSEIAQHKKYKDALEKFSPLIKPLLTKGEIDPENFDKFIESISAKSRNDIAAKLLDKVKDDKHVKLDDFWDGVDNRTIQPGSPDNSHVIVYGKFKAKSYGDFSFSITGGKKDLPCKMNVPELYSEESKVSDFSHLDGKDVAVFGEVKRNPKTLERALDVAILYLKVESTREDGELEK